MAKDIKGLPNINAGDAAIKARATATLAMKQPIMATLRSVPKTIKKAITRGGPIDGAAPNGDDDDPEDHDYYPESEEDLSLGPDEFDIPEEPLDDPRL